MCVLGNKWPLEGCSGSKSKPKKKPYTKIKKYLTKNERKTDKTTKTKEYEK